MAAASITDRSVSALRPAVPVLAATRNDRWTAGVLAVGVVLLLLVVTLVAVLLSQPGALLAAEEGGGPGGGSGVTVVNEDVPETTPGGAAEPVQSPDDHADDPSVLIHFDDPAEFNASVTNFGGMNVADAGEGDGSGDEVNTGLEGDNLTDDEAKDEARYRRWVMMFEPGPASEYGKTLDAVGIELAAVVRHEKRLIYLSQTLSGSPILREGDAETSEDCFSMSWAEGSARAEADRELFADAGVKLPVDAEFVHFYSASAEAELSRLERAYSGLNVDQIRRTVFGIRSVNGVYRFVVLSQRAAE